MQQPSPSLGKQPAISDLYNTVLRNPRALFGKGDIERCSLPGGDVPLPQVLPMPHEVVRVSLFPQSQDLAQGYQDNWCLRKGNLKSPLLTPPSSSYCKVFWFQSVSQREISPSVSIQVWGGGAPCPCPLKPLVQLFLYSIFKEPHDCRLKMDSYKPRVISGAVYQSLKNFSPTPGTTAPSIHKPTQPMAILAV